MKAYPSAKKIPVVDIKSDYVPLVGGEDLITPSISVNPGRAIIAQNYELDVQGRYQLCGGYEAFDGRPKPSEATYHVLNFDAGSRLAGVTETITGAGGAYATVIESYVEGGTFSGGDLYGYYVIYAVSGTFIDNEVLSSGGAPYALVNGVTQERGVSDDIEDSRLYLAAIELARADIEAVPGSGSVLGVWQYNGVKYAFRNNALGTAAVLHKSSTSGWTAVDLGYYLAFTSGGTTEIEEGDTITGETGGATALVERVVLKTGTWAGGDAQGYFILSGQTGTFESETVKVGVDLNLATIASDSTAQTLLPNGRYEFINENFGGHAGTRRMYGCDGVNKSFEFDGSVYVPIYTGMTNDAPTHITGWKNHLVLMFPGGSIQNSSLGNPYVWDPVTDASEMMVGDEGTGFLQLPNALACFSRNSIKLLYGTTTDDWDLRPHSDEAGAVEWSMQKIGSGIFLDDRGITSLSAVQEYGDFHANILSKYIHPWLKDKISDVQCSLRVKDKNQYRLFFNDMQAVTMTLDGNKLIGFTRQLYDVLPVCACSTEDSTGKEELFFGSTDGFVYQMDSGRTFNGSALSSIVKFHFNHLKRPNHYKRIRFITLELTAPINTYLQFNVEFDYGDTGNESQTFLLDSPGGVWGVDDWDAFIWGTGSTASLPIDIDGEGRNFSLTIYNSGEFEVQETGLRVGFEVPDYLQDSREGATGSEPHVLQGYIVDYDIRARSR